MLCRAFHMSQYAFVPFRGRVILATVCCLMISTQVVFSQDEQAESAQKRKLYESIKWQQGPCTASILGDAEITVPAGYQFTGPEGVAIYEKVAQQPPSGSVGLLTLVDSFDWNVWFSYDGTGYIPDDDKGELDADAILKNIGANTEAANEISRENGWPELHVAGWIHPPAYDQRTNNLTWAILAKSSDGDAANYDIRLLGRRGVMSVKLVTSPEQMDTHVPTVKGLLSGFRFQPGETYAEFSPGDKVAEYGLTALIVGVGTAAAAKTGLLAKLAAFFVKGGKYAFLALAAVAAGIWKMLTGNSNSVKEGK